MKSKKHIVNNLIKKYANSDDEKAELWKIVEEIVHHRIVGCVLDNLPREHHEEFLEKLNNNDFNEELLSYVNTKTSKNMESEIQKEIDKISEEILIDLKLKRK